MGQGSGGQQAGSIAAMEGVAQQGKMLAVNQALGISQAMLNMKNAGVKPAEIENLKAGAEKALAEAGAINAKTPEEVENLKAQRDKLIAETCVQNQLCKQKELENEFKEVEIIQQNYRTFGETEGEVAGKKKKVNIFFDSPSQGQTLSLNKSCHQKHMKPHKPTTTYLGPQTPRPQTSQLS